MSQRDQSMADGGPTQRGQVPTPGDAHSVPVPNEHAAEGTSEQFPAVDGVRRHPRPEGESQGVFSEGEQDD